MSAPVVRALSRDQVLSRASAGVGKIDLYGPRGVTMVSAEEIEAMACLLVMLGLVPTWPGAAAPPAFFLQNQKG